MKRSFYSVLILLLCVILPISAYAESYQLSDTDLTVQIDDSGWYVFTRDNLENNAELEELGISVDEMSESLQDNKAYLDAIVRFGEQDYIELFIRKTAQTTGVANLSNYDDDEVMEFVTALAERQNSQVYSIYKTQYKFSKSEYFDSDVEMYVYEFCTIVNKENYTFTFQSPSAFTDGRKMFADKIMETVQFDVDPSLKEPKTENPVIRNTIVGAVVGGIAGGAVALINKKKSKKTSENQGPEVE